MVGTKTTIRVTPHKGRSDGKDWGEPGERSNVRSWKDEIKQRRVGMAEQTMKRESHTAQIFQPGQFLCTGDEVRSPGFVLAPESNFARREDSQEQARTQH
jgi:hypothetical protein